MLLCAKRAYPCIAASIASLPAFIVVRIAKRSNCVSSSLGSVFNAQERWKRYGAEVELSKLLRGIEFARARGGVTALRKQEQRCCLNVAAYIREVRCPARSSRLLRRTSTAPVALPIRKGKRIRSHKTTVTKLGQQATQLEPRVYREALIFPIKSMYLSPYPPRMVFRHGRADISWRKEEGFRSQLCL